MAEPSAPVSRDTQAGPSEAYSETYLRYVMLIAFLVVVVNVMDRYVISILLEQIKADLSITDAQLGWLVGPAFVVVHVLCQLPLARIADRTIRRSMIAGAMALWSLLTMAAGLARSFPELLVARMGVGITEAAASPTLASLLSDYFSPERRGRAMAMFGVGGTAGIGAGMLVGGIVGQEYGWRIALLAAGLPGIVLAIVIRTTIREPARGSSEDRSPAHAEETPPTSQVIRILLGTRSFRWLVVGASLAMVTSLGRGAWEPVFLIRVYEMDQSSAALWYFLIGPIPGMAGAMLGGIATDRLSARDARWYMWMPALATFLATPCMIAFLLWPESHAFPLGAIPIGFAFSVLGSLVGGMVTPATIATGQSLARPSFRAMTHALWTMASNLVGMGLGPLAVGILSDSLSAEHGDLSIRYALVIVTLVGFGAAAALFLGASTIREDLARARA